MVYDKQKCLVVPPPHWYRFIQVWLCQVQSHLPLLQGHPGLLCTEFWSQSLGYFLFNSFCASLHYVFGKRLRKHRVMFCFQLHASVMKQSTYFFGCLVQSSQQGNWKLHFFVLKSATTIYGLC